jgi:hypothetical protein
MSVNNLSDRVADLALERVTSLLADRIAERVVKALMELGLDKQMAASLSQRFKEESGE